MRSSKRRCRDSEVDMEPLISVIIPVYKVENYLRRCVDSVLAQTYQNMEILLIDDGSPDECPKICEEYAVKDPRIRVVHQENKGLSGARNTGIGQAKGAYLSFLDSDDIYSPYFLESLYRAISAYDADISQCRWEYMHGDHLKETYRPEAECECLTGREMLGRLYIQTGAYYVVAWNKLYKKELFKEIRYPEGRIHEDEATTYRLFDLAKKCVLVDNALYGYFVGTGGTSITRNGFQMKKLDWIRANEERVCFFLEKDYQELIVPSVKAWNDGSIDLYFKCKNYCPTAKEEMKKIRKSVKKTIPLIRKYGSLPLQTMIGYRLFVILPTVYGKLLTHVADMTHVEKYS